MMNFLKLGNYFEVEQLMQKSGLVLISALKA